jgi:hypothetical protein
LAGSKVGSNDIAAMDEIKRNFGEVGLYSARSTR